MATQNRHVYTIPLSALPLPIVTSSRPTDMCSVDNILSPSCHQGHFLRRISPTSRLLGFISSLPIPLLHISPLCFRPPSGPFSRALHPARAFCTAVPKSCERLVCTILVTWNPTPCLYILRSLLPCSCLRTASVRGFLNLWVLFLLVNSVVGTACVAFSAIGVLLGRKGSMVGLN
jgi:hypothetical protein